MCLRKSELYQGDALVRQSIIILALLNQSIPLVTVRSNVSLLTEQLFAHSTLVHFVSKNKVLSLFLLWSKEFEGVLVFDTKLNQFQFSFVFIKFQSILETTTLHIYLSIVRQAAPLFSNLKASLFDNLALVLRWISISIQVMLERL